MSLDDSCAVSRPRVFTENNRPDPFYETRAFPADTTAIGKPVENAVNAVNAVNVVNAVDSQNKLVLDSRRPMRELNENMVTFFASLLRLMVTNPNPLLDELDKPFDYAALVRAIAEMTSTPAPVNFTNPGNPYVAPNPYGTPIPPFTVPSFTAPTVLPIWKSPRGWQNETPNSISLAGQGTQADTRHDERHDRRPEESMWSGCDGYSDLT